MAKKKNEDVLQKQIDESFLCGNPLYPEHNGKFCLCAGCRHLDYYCTEDPCEACDGPVKEGECNYDEKEDENG